jgi:hypothetical protein
MINFEEGNFLHIDFGHFLGNVKKKFGIKRERDPFVFTKEIAYFVNGGPLTKRGVQKVTVRSNNGQPFTEEEHREMSDSIINGEEYSPERGGGFEESMSYSSSKHPGGNIGGIS